MIDQKIGVLAFLLCLIAGSNSQPLPPCNDPNQQLVNTVVYEGDSSSFFNQIDPLNVKWEIAPSFDLSGEPTPPYLVADDDITQYPDVYTVTPTQLTIPTASIYPRLTDPFSTAGLYMVTYKTDGCQAMANLIVVIKGPVCLCTVIDPDNAELSCEMEYGLAHILPNYVTMTWTKDNGDTVAIDTPISNQDQLIYDISRSTYQVTSTGDASYTCGVTFGAPDSVVPNMATNAPTFTASCTIENCVKRATINPTTTNSPTWRHNQQHQKAASTTTPTAGAFPPKNEIAITEGGQLSAAVEAGFCSIGPRFKSRAVRNIFSQAVTCPSVQSES